MTTKEPQYQTDALFRGLRGLLASLPSEEEKSELIGTLLAAQKLLEELRLLAEAIPTAESSEEISSRLSHLRLLADQNSGDPKLRRLLGLRSAAKPKQSSNLDAEGVEARALSMENDLAAMETDEVLAAMERTDEPVAVLAALARRLGMRVGSKGRKADLAKRIATHIANQRSYALLRNRAAKAR